MIISKKIKAKLIPNLKENESWKTFKPPTKLNLNENAVNNWKSFKQRFDIYLTATDKKTVAEERKVAIFQNCIGENALDIYNTFNLSEENLTLTKVYEAFDIYIKPRTSVVIERHKFFTRTQQPEKPFDNFLNDLKKMIKNCEFGE